jgi:hypothetical protein
MKTIIDAVNELQGDLNNVSYIKGDDTYHCNVNYNVDSGWWCSRGVYCDFVCTINDFTKKASQQAKTELIDGKAYQFDMFNGNVPRKTVSGIYSAEDDEFIYLQNVVRTGDCTNIQPLTLENK